MKLSDIRSTATIKPPRLLIHGQAGIGKTTFASTLPNPIFVQTEDGLGKLSVPHFPLAQSFEDVTSALTELITQEHDFNSVVVDSVDWLENLVHRHTCMKHNQASIESFGYGKGYVEALAYWREYLGLLNTLRDKKGMIVCQIAHSKAERINPPDAEEYSQWQVKLKKHANELVQEHSDIVGYAKIPITIKKSEGAGGRMTAKAVSDGNNRQLQTFVSPACVAKNRYGITTELPLDWAALSAAITGKEPKPKNPTTKPEKEAA